METELEIMFLLGRLADLGHRSHFPPIEKSAPAKPPCQELPPHEVPGHCQSPDPHSPKPNILSPPFAAVPPMCCDDFAPPPPPSEEMPPETPQPPHRPPRGGMHAPGRILDLLLHEDGVSQNTLASKLNVRPQSLSEMLGKMEERGHITRRANENDKRETLVFLTETGRKIHAEFYNRRLECAKTFLAPLSEAEQAQLLLLLRKLFESTKPSL